MAPKIKLTYFDVRARAELSRMILAQAGVEYEDCRIKGEDWQKMKPGKKRIYIWIDGVTAHFICHFFSASVVNNV